MEESSDSKGTNDKARVFRVFEPMTTQPIAAHGLQLLVEESQREKVVHCSGRITADNSERFQQQIRHLIPETRDQMAAMTPKIVIDLSSVTYVDSAGLGALLGAWTAAQSRGCDLEITNLNPRVEKLVEITKLDSVFKRGRIVAAAGSAAAASASKILRSILEKHADRHLTPGWWFTVPTRLIARLRFPR